MLRRGAFRPAAAAGSEQHSRGDNDPSARGWRPGESLEEISKLLDGHPHFHSPDASIEVREFLSMPGMS
ncbi:MAG TPA: hypothetical protein VFW50_38960 [Streptosporangiaceae bacterium]|nr:hypothetical protein [Streptosporangiaceae bacterium]